MGSVDEGEGAELIEGWLCGFGAAPLQLVVLAPGRAVRVLEWPHVQCTYAGDLIYN